MRRFLSLILVVCMMVPLLAACSKGDKVTLFEGGTVTIVYDESMLTTGEAKAFAAEVREKAGVTTTIKTKYEAGEGAKLLLGNLAECRSVTTDMRSKDYALCVSGTDYVIGAVNADALKKAMDYFLETVLAGLKDGVITLSSEEDHIFTGDYKTQPFSIGGVALSLVKIVIPKTYSVSEYRTAVLLQQHLSTALSYTVPIVHDKSEAPDGRILIGSSLCEGVDVNTPHSYSVTVSGSEMKVAAESFYGYEAVQNVLQKNVFASRAQKPAIDDSVTYTGVGSAAEAVLEREGDIRVMFNNIHGFDDAEFPGKPVAMMMSEVFLEYMPDILGLQEYHKGIVNAGQLADRLSPVYKSVESAWNETPIFYRPDTVEVLQHGYFCFNDVPYTNSAYTEYLNGEDASKLLTDNILQRTGEKGVRRDGSKGFTWAIFRAKATGNIFLVASTHLWWESNDAGDLATRKIQIAYLKDFLEKTAKTYAQSIGAATLPIIAGGDYNSSFGSDKTAGDISVMTSESKGEDGSTVGRFVDMNTLAPAGKRNDITTHHGYATWDNDLGIYVRPDKSTAAYKYAIDYIFTNRSADGMLTVKRSAMSQDLYSYLSSDHSPILVDVSFTSSAPKN